ncbi:hypothetical protein BGZ47_003383, partial [Haplosporangium gracile]
IRHVTARCVSHHFLHLLAQHCPNIEHLDITFEFYDPGIIFRTFWGVMLKSCGRLERVVITYCDSVYGPEFFERLFLAPQLKELELFPIKVDNHWRTRTHRPSMHLAILDRYPSMEKYTVGKVQYCEEPVMGDTVAGRILEGIRSVTDWVCGGTPGSHPLKILTLHEMIPDFEIFRQFVHRCSSLEELYLSELAQGGWGGHGPISAWTTLSTYCRQIRIIFLETTRVSPTTPDLPEVADFVSWFPQLQSLHLSNFHFSQDPDLTRLHTALEQHEESHGKRHPLKFLYLSGMFSLLLKVLLDFMAVGTSAIETFTIRFPHSSLT